MNPASDFIRGLFYQPPDYSDPRPLPDNTNFHMMYGHRRDESSFGPSGDGVLSLRSMTRTEAIEAARYRALPLDYDHTEILRSTEALDRLRVILDSEFD